MSNLHATQNQILFALARHVSPALSGQSFDPQYSEDQSRDGQIKNDQNRFDNNPENSNQGLLQTGQDNTQVLQDFYQSLQQLYPLPGKPYWQARGWTLLTWQPLYLSFLTLYGLGSVPSALGQVSQQTSEGMVSGYFLPQGPWYSLKNNACTVPELIAFTCEKLRPMISQLQQEFEAVSGFNQAKSQRALADQLLIILLRLADAATELFPRFVASLPEEQHTLWGFSDLPWLHQRLRHKETVIADAILWLKGLDLPVEHYQRIQDRSLLNDQAAQTLQADQALQGAQALQTAAGAGLYLERLTCCMHYRREDGELCDNCPRLKNRRSASTSDQTCPKNSRPCNDSNPQQKKRIKPLKVA